MKKSKSAFPLKQLMLVDWVDSTSRGGWQDMSGYANAEPWLCRSLGFLFKRNANGITLMQTQSMSGSVTDSITIPASCIRRVRRLS